MKERFAALFKTKTRDEWCALLEGSDACFAPVLSMREAPEHPHNAQPRHIQPRVRPAATRAGAALQSHAGRYLPSASPAGPAHVRGTRRLGRRPRADGTRAGQWGGYGLASGVIGGLGLMVWSGRWILLSRRSCDVRNGTAGLTDVAAVVRDAQQRARASIRAVEDVAGCLAVRHQRSRGICRDPNRTPSYLRSVR